MGDAGRSSDALAAYDRARAAAATLLDELAARAAADATWYGASDDLGTLARTIARLRDGRFVLAVVGEFSSGKSFLLNALLGKVAHEERAGSTRIVGLLATDINPSTATITELSYGATESAVAHYPNGRQERIPLGRLSRFVAVAQEQKLHDATGDARDAPNLVRVEVDSPFLAGGFTVADTPGLASINSAHRRATLNYLPSADAVLYLIDTQQPFTDGDASFLGIVRRYIESIFIVQTKIDLWRLRDGERETWEVARNRIVSQAAVHAPDVPVFALSARDFAESRITGDAALAARSRFPLLLDALDVSLVGTTGRFRLRRAASDARRIATRAADALARDIEAFGADDAELAARRAEYEPIIEAVDAAGRAAQLRLAAAGAALREATIARGVTMREQVARSLSRAFDIADIARLRDRAKLHAIVDDTLASAVGRFAADLADAVAGRLRGEAKAAVDDLVAAGRTADASGALRVLLDAVAGERLPVTDDAARRFRADAGGGAWSASLESGLRSTIVLGALAGPGISLVAAIAARFAAVPHGAYMKRELQADLQSSLFSTLDAELGAFVDGNAERVDAIANDLGVRAATLAARVRAEALGPLERALDAQDAGSERAARIAAAHERRAALETLATRVEGVSETFAAFARTVRGAGELAAALPSAESGDGAPRFDPQTYEHGLRPERYRVAIVGALRRGKSSLINAIAGARVLDDEGGEIDTIFPIHVRYGPASAAYALGDDANWDPIDPAAAIDAATRTPVLIETPWHLPRQLVLVHVPAFDSGRPDAEAIVLAAARSASEVLALFSRQLSDRELAVYGRLAETGASTSFVHTLADNEAAGERRHVVELADRYLRERAIVPQRIFTVSALDYRAARAAGTAPGAWNELGALVETLASRADEHMARLARADRDRAERERLASAGRPAPTAPKRSLLDRLLGRR